nr:LytR C-terminal domain-containing protein [Candidatus Levybacteria bacterium]
MPKKNKKKSNIKLAGLFVLLVLGLVILSVFFKIVFLIRDSRFDGIHKFNIEFIANEEINIVSFSPLNKSLTMLSVKDKIDNKDNLSKSLGVPVDGRIITKDRLTKNNTFLILLKSILPFGNSIKDLTQIDLFRLALFSRMVSDVSISEKEISSKFNDAQKSTIISLLFSDSSIYEENQTIEIINSTDVYGLGGRLANLISHMGGNVVLVSSGDKIEKASKIIYSGKLTYTVKKLSNYLNMPLEKSDKKSIADVIIIIGTDKAEGDKF